MKKIIGKIALWVLTIALVIGLIATYFMMKGQSRYSAVPSETQINIHHLGPTKGLIPKDLIKKHLPFNLQDSTLQAINTQEVEDKLLAEIPFIKEVNAYVSPADHTLNIDISGRTPILRCYAGNLSYFLDDEGNLLPTNGGVSVYLPIVQVNQLNDEIRNEVLLPLANFLQDHSKWYSFFGMIQVISTHQIHFYPRVGSFVFETIGVENLEEDFDKIELFYKKIVPQVGSNKYQLIKLSYRNQIVCQ